MAPFRAWRLVAMAAGGSILMAACGGGSSGLTTGDIKDAGQLVYCSDITYPPEEFYQGNTPVGSDIDIGNEIADRVAGVKGEFDNTGFDGIIPALLSKKCDAIISGMNDTADRRKQVDFVDYLSVGQSIMVAVGNPEGVKSLTDLSGLAVAVEIGTTNKDFLDQESEKLKGQGKDPIDVTTFPKDTDAANALKTGKVDAYFGDSPVVAYYIKQDPQSFAFGGEPVNPLPVGIAVRKEDAGFEDAVKKAVDEMYSDGTMCRILAKWQLTGVALEGHTC
jgi:polar amino acid transport system substrate-binding protein